MAEQEVDVRPLGRPNRHPTVFANYHALPVGGSLVLVNDHDPKHLRDEFDTDQAGGFDWEYLAREPGNWRVRITKRAGTPLPRVLGNTAELVTGARDTGGAVWKLPMRDRDLDANVISLPATGRIDAHAGPDNDVLIHVLAGSGQLDTERGVVELRPGDLLWLPRRSRRAFTAGADGLRYLTVHQRRQALTLHAP